MLTLEQGTRLAGLARRLLTSRLFKPSKRDRDTFSMHWGCFVTLHHHGQVAGSAGVVRTDLPLIEVLTHGVAHAKDDPRVKGKRTLRECTVEVCVVSPPRRIDVHSPSEYPQRIKSGMGVLVKGTYHEGYVLPQTALAHRMEPITMLRQASQHAQLHPDDWQDFDKATVYGFSVQIFGENAPGGEIIQIV